MVEPSVLRSAVVDVSRAVHPGLGCRGLAYPGIPGATMPRSLPRSRLYSPTEAADVFSDGPTQLPNAGHCITQLEWTRFPE